MATVSIWDPVSQAVRTHAILQGFHCGHHKQKTQNRDESFGIQSGDR